MASKIERLSKLNQLIASFKQKVQQNNIQLPRNVKIVELGPRDGLQNEKTIVSPNDKIDFINRLNDCGFQSIEVTSFVSPKWVPQMADNKEVYSKIKKLQNVNYPVLVPNLKGLEQALEVGVKEIAVFSAASEGFTKKNINCTIEESLQKFQEIFTFCKDKNIKIRGYVSTVMGCPYDGDVNPEKVKFVSDKLFEMGCYEVSLGDTIGVGTPEKTQKLFNVFPHRENLAAHFHDTYDKAIPNLLVALENGISVIDSSVGGLGGCPYAKTSAGNVCTENVVYTLHELGIETGIDLKKLAQVGEQITKKLGRENMSVV
ncbi:hypothetical protein PPERSA_10673 [Pseudocohnilembus persalinus]|uniref:hydroxymethylglutaryl-CoA lyase n=1 Tax=Pseudocohnilembus persalinus TaxID=266149 RepID=A0A0V0QD99_PSEPJ|nr:hypothetical protein PPERSA_10673 [Pseudocohnilembus persalinus]|eukprot:KRX00174.1 hypothetical protein PPERSA_10673 [Pseudocohnilembus persalinus]